MKRKFGNYLVDKFVFRERLEKITNHAKQKDIEEKAGISNGISRIYSGEAALTVDHLIQLSKAYNCSIDYLLGIDNDSENDSKRASTVYEFAKAVNDANKCGAIKVIEERYNLDDRESGKSIEITGKCIRILDYDLNDAVSFVLVLDRATQYSEKYGEGVLEQFLEGLKENHKPLQKANVNDWIKNGYNE